MRQPTLRSGLILVVFAALIPIGTISVMQALSVLDYNRTLISNRLATSALATAGRDRDPLIIAERVLKTVSRIEEVRAMVPNCGRAMAVGLIDNPGIANFVRVRASGQVACSVMPFEPGTNFSKETWWQRGSKLSRFTISTVVMGPISKQLVLIGMQPMFKKDGTPDGSVLVGIKTAWLQKTLADEKLAQHAIVALVAANGQTVMIDGAAGLPKIDVKAANGQVIEKRADDGRDWLYAAAPLYDGELYIVYAEPSEELMSAVVTQARVGLALPILALLLTSLAMWVGTNRLVVRWLDKLRLLADQFSEGNYQSDPSGFAKAPREIALLSGGFHTMGTAIEARDRDLKSALEIKTALTSEVHHRVKNNLQIVSSLLSLQAGKIVDATAREALNQTRARIGALSQIHRLLYEEAHETDVVDLSRLLSELCAQLRSLHRHQANIRLVCDAESHMLAVSNAVPLSLFAVEAITNCFRHAFRDSHAGIVTLHSSWSGDQGTLRVSDDGVGFDPQHESNSMGHQLMEAFAQQLGGEFSFVTGANGGSVVTLAYPLVTAKD